MLTHAKRGMTLLKFHSVCTERNSFAGKALSLAYTLQANLTAEMQAEGGNLTERQAVQKLAQPCLTALADLHAKGISHGAILPDNMLFSSQEQSGKLAGDPTSCSSSLSAQHACMLLIHHCGMSLWRN